MTNTTIICFAVRILGGKKKKEIFFSFVWVGWKNKNVVLSQVLHFLIFLKSIPTIISLQIFAFTSYSTISLHIFISTNNYQQTHLFHFPYRKSNFLRRNQTFHFSTSYKSQSLPPTTPYDEKNNYKNRISSVLTNGVSN